MVDMVASDNPLVQLAIEAACAHITESMAPYEKLLLAQTRARYAVTGHMHNELRVIIAAVGRRSLPYTERVLRTILRHGAAAASDAETALAEIEGRL